MLYEFKNGKVMTKAVEYSVSYHCNLRCSGCSHMSPFIHRTFPSLESFVADIEKLGEGLHAVDIRLVGGEPLLNPEINAFVKAAKNVKIADTVMVTTNGLLLHRMNDEFWENVDFVSVTLYPDALPREENIGLFKERAKESNTRLRLFPSAVFRTTIVTEPHPRDWITGMIFKTCKNAHRYHCHMIHEGRLYKCAVPPFLPEYLSKIGINGFNPEIDAFDIHKADNIVEGLRRYLMSFETLEACRYCLGHLGKPQEHHQLKSEYLINPGQQNITRGNYLDRFKFIKESIRYFHRRTVEKLTGEQTW